MRLTLFVLPFLLATLSLGGCPTPVPYYDDDDAAEDDDDSGVTADDDDLAADDDDVADDDDSTDDVDDDDDDDDVADDDDAAEALDPFAPRPDTGEGLVNVSFDLEELLENGELEGACAAWQADPSDRRTKLLCGKWMFFYEGFGTLGIPEAMYDWMSRSFPDELGLAFSEYGLVPDPYQPADAPRPLGVGVGAPMDGNPPLALTCANCHFGQMPDGRYAVGYANYEYEYGSHMLALMLGPMAGIPGFDASAHHPDAIATVQPILDRFAADPMLGLALMWEMLPMMRGGASDIPAMPVDVEGMHASWAPGTMDFAIAPLPIEDEVHTISKTIPLWGIPTADEEAAFGMSGSMLAWTGAAQSLTQFLQGFVIVGDGPLDQWGPDELSPLREYLESLEPPPPLTPPDAGLVAQGRALFTSAGCEDCHAGPRGGGLEVFDLDEIGTDPAIGDWGDADGDGLMCCGLGDPLTGGVKAPRLGGLHAQGRLLHNGSLTSLEQLFCLEPRPADVVPPYSSAGHSYGCELAGDELTALLAFLRSL